MWRDSLNQYNHQVNAEVKFNKYIFPILFLEVFWKQHFRFILTDDLQTNILKFFTGHGAIVEQYDQHSKFDKCTAWSHIMAYAFTSKTHEFGNK